MVPINILIYTDRKHISLDNDNGEKRVTILKSRLETKILAFAEFRLNVTNRYDGFTETETGTLRKITDDLLKDVDELWIFGMYQKSVPGKFTEEFGAPENEFDKNELKVLEDWMNRGGGVLIAGDHSAFRPGGNETDPIETFQCLGRALGHLVPRAGQLRIWDGPPTINFDSSFNTLVRTVADTENNPDLQQDPLPQTLLLKKFGPNQTPHRIFLGKEATISIFPDHAHEGGVVVPKKLGDEWPPFDEKDDEKKPPPEIVAYGCDKRSCHSRPVLALYDGDEFKVGRIAADSSWHHYLNINLVAFTASDQASTLQLLTEFFHNLALFLAPLSKRQQMSREMMWWLRRHPEIEEERGNHPLAVGQVALHYLSKKTTRCEIQELLQVAGLATGVDLYRLNLSNIAAGFGHMPSQELVVGALLNCFYRAASEQLNEEVNSTDAQTEEDIIKRGFQEAFGIHEEFLNSATSNFKDLHSKSNR